MLLNYSLSFRNGLKNVVIKVRMLRWEIKEWLALSIHKWSCVLKNEMKKIRGNKGYGMKAFKIGLGRLIAIQIDMHFFSVA